MKYILLIYQDEKRWHEIGEGERQQIYGEFGKLKEQLQASGRYLSGSELQATTTGVSVRIRNDKELITDGPFAETHEQLGGYMLIEANDLGEAITVAKQIPLVRTGIVEVRPLLERAAEVHA
ncbi:MAG TPA: YciI family protein [Pyrinomonadaceae bacterium]|nr:YciI family protein [Pyrinomonadaceae bacterium]